MSDEGLVDDPAQAFYVNNGAEMFAVVARREDRLNLLLDHWPLARVECQRLRLADFIKCRDIFQAKLQAPQDESENHRVRALIDLWVHRIRAYLAEDLPAWVDSFSTENFTPQSPGELATSPDLAAYMNARTAELRAIKNAL